MYLLDFSPSAASPDICVGGGGGPGAVLLDQQVAALRRAVEGVIRPFYVPGSQVQCSVTSLWLSSCDPGPVQT